MLPATLTFDPADYPDRGWTQNAIRVLESDACRSAETHLINPAFKGLNGISVYLKDESTHPTGSLKHRLARSLFLYGICNEKITNSTTVVEASSGSTAVSEAYFAKLLGLPFIAVMTKNTSLAKIDEIERFGGRCTFVNNPAEIYDTAARIAEETGGHYLDQFTNAERATDWRGNDNIAESIFRQMIKEPHPIPSWIIVGAGTGGTSATIGRYIRYKNLNTRLCVADVEHSVYYDSWRKKNNSIISAESSRIEGIGRPRVEPSFIPSVVDNMVKVPDAASIAAAHVLSERLARRVGASTGTSFFGLLSVAAGLSESRQSGSLVALICDSGDRYSDTYFDPAWLMRNGIDIVPWYRSINDFLDKGVFVTPT